MIEDSRPIKKATNDPQLAPHIKGQIIIQTCITFESESSY
jgi:hypothetical protein